MDKSLISFHLKYQFFGFSLVSKNDILPTEGKLPLMKNHCSRVWAACDFGIYGPVCENTDWIWCMRSYWKLPPINNCPWTGPKIFWKFTDPHNEVQILAMDIFSCTSCEVFWNKKTCCMIFTAKGNRYPIMTNNQNHRAPVPPQHFKNDLIRSYP